jgi:hypothetical protein
MPRGPRGEKRPADVIGAAVMVARIATGEIEDMRTNPHAAALGNLGGAKGGKARAKAMTKAERSDSARHAARASERATNAFAARRTHNTRPRLLPNGTISRCGCRCAGSLG